ncbi:CHASE2 domain-containing protein [Paracoccus cavernae]|uniref:CHASE2 domain-containing protein n=1 Tax=Paracoccus cavernae TaxID=1571207 RepID=UPI0035F3BDD7
MASFWPRSPAARRRAVVVLAGIVTLCLVLSLTVGARGALNRLSYQVFDAYQRLSPRAAGDPAVAVVDIDEASIAALGQWPWPRNRMAGLIDVIGQSGAAVIALDIAFSEPDRTSLEEAVRSLEAMGARVEIPQGAAITDNDEAFAQAIARNPVVLGVALSNETKTGIARPKAGFSYGGSDPNGYLPHYAGGVGNLAILSGAARGIGNFSYSLSADSVVRRMPMVVGSPEGLYPALGIEALRVATGASGFIIRSSDASGEIGGRQGGAGMLGLKVADFEIPTGPNGEFWLHYSGMPTMPVISAATILDPARGAEIRAALEGRIVLIGTSAIGLRDIVATPISAAWPGVKVHAEVIDQIINQSFLIRPEWALGLEIAAAFVAGLVLVAVVAWGGPVLSSLALCLMLAGVAGASWYGFRHLGLLLDPVLPALCLLAVFLVTAPLLILLGNREKKFVRRAFGQYLSPTLVSRLSENPEALQLGGEERELTVLFSDIRGFTTLSETLDPTTLTALLNGLLTPMTDVLLEQEATIDKYIGDAIMAFWNAPLAIADHPRKACLAALGMIAAVERMGRETGRDIRVGIGLHSGPACVGNLGSIRRFSYSAIGDSVNLCARIEGLTKQYGIAIAVSETTRAAAPELAFIEIDRVSVVGRKKPVTIYALLGDAEAAKDAGFRAGQSAFAAFLMHYRARNFSSALKLLTDSELSSDRRLSGVYRLYQERIADLVGGPLDEFERDEDGNWNGVYYARSK